MAAWTSPKTNDSAATLTCRAIMVLCLQLLVRRFRGAVARSGCGRAVFWSWRWGETPCDGSDQHRTGVRNCWRWRRSPPLPRPIPVSGSTSSLRAMSPRGSGGAGQVRQGPGCDLCHRRPDHEDQEQPVARDPGAGLCLCGQTPMPSAPAAPIDTVSAEDFLQWSEHLGSGRHQRHGFWL